MKAIRRLSYVTLVIAFAQIVFGAIVRITGSGWGCGEHWPKCDGRWVPPFDRPDLIIEVMHRYLALGVTLAALALAIAAWRRRRDAGVAGRGGPLRPAAGAFFVVVATALLGMITIKLRLNPIVIVAHLGLAMTLLATIIVAGFRAGAFGAASATLPTPDDVARAAAARSWRVARIAVALAFTVLLLGALVANLGAGGACLGFPTCRVYASPNRGLVHLQLTHRVIAFLLALHVLGAAMMLRKRAVAPIVKRAARLALGAIVLQIVVAAALVESHLPPVLQSLHQAVGTLVWISIVVWAALAHRAAGSDPARLRRRSPEPLPADQDRGGDGGVVRTAEPVTGASLVMLAPAGLDADAVARFAEFDRAARCYEAAITALVAEGEAIAETFEESLVVVTAEFPLPSDATVDAEVSAPVALEAAPITRQAPDPVALPLGTITPAQPIPAIKRPHSVAVIVARGADF